jgi:hypothetical protein
LRPNPRDCSSLLPIWRLRGIHCMASRTSSVGVPRKRTRHRCLEKLSAVD